MRYYGIVIHHSACPSINGRGFDFYITRGGAIIPSSEQTDPLYIHICLEGDFCEFSGEMTPQLKEQFFLLNKLILRLSETFHFSTDEIFPHSHFCPGTRFPWSELVISWNDRYH